MLRMTALGALGFCFACSSPNPTDDGGTDAGTDAPVAFTYSPQGCSYTVSVPGAHGFLAQALDDGAAITDVTGATPARVRIGLGGTTAGADPTSSAAFTWETPNPVGAAQVRIGTQPASLTDVHKGYVWQTPPPTIGIGNNEPAVNMHEVHACGLQPGTTYYYQVGGGISGQEAWSATQSFTTVPATGPITIGISGDSRDSAPVFQMVQERMRDATVAMQIFSGDFVLWGSQESLYQQWLDSAWKDPADNTKFLTLGQQLILPIPGNHENSSSQFYGNFALPGDGPFAEAFFSVDIGSAHILSFDDQAIAQAVTSDEAVAALAFIDSDLGKAEQNRAAHPFLVVQHHRGEFSTSTHGDDLDVIAARNTLFPIFSKHHVDLVLSGHDHNYERSKPITGDPTNPTVTTPDQGVSYVVCAGAGANAYSPGSAAVAYRAINIGFGGSTPYVGVYALMTLDVHTLDLKAYGLKASGTGVSGDDLIDTLTLTR